MKKLIFSVGAAMCLFASALQAAELVIYSGRSDNFVKPAVAEFEKQSGVKVILHTSDSTALINKLALEGHRTTADVFLSNDAGNLQVGSNKELFATLPGEITGPIPANYRADDDTWVGISGRGRVLVVNNNAKDLDFAQSVFDLADPRLQDRLAITHSGNGSYIAGVTVYQQAKGDQVVRQWLEGMKENVDGEVFNKHSKIVDAVAKGKKDVGLVNHYYIYRHLVKEPDAPITIRMPDQGKDGMGIAWNVAGAAISKHAKNKAAAEQFLSFLVSEQGQKIFAEVNQEYPTRPGVPTAAGIPSMENLKVADVPMSTLGNQRGATLDLIEAVGMP